MYNWMWRCDKLKCDYPELNLGTNEFLGFPYRDGGQLTGRKVGDPKAATLWLHPAWMMLPNGYIAGTSLSSAPQTICPRPDAVRTEFHANGCKERIES